MTNMYHPLFFMTFYNLGLDKKWNQQFHSLRWQIELIFKTWKSIFYIHSNTNVKKERFFDLILAPEPDHF